MSPQLKEGRFSRTSRSASHRGESSQKVQQQRGDSQRSHVYCCPRVNRSTLSARTHPKAPLKAKTGPGRVGRSALGRPWLGHMLEAVWAHTAAATEEHPTQQSSQASAHLWQAQQQGHLRELPW